jgi:hypothetical protein
VHCKIAEQEVDMSLEYIRLTKRIDELEERVRKLDEQRTSYFLQHYCSKDAPALAKPTNDVVVIVLCINYADKLKIALRKNAKFFKHIYVITTKQDNATQDLCKQYKNVHCHITNLVNKNNEVFNKGAMIHELQTILHKKYPTKWILLLDADIVLPKEFLSLLQIAKLTPDKDTIYGMHRIDFATKHDFNKRANGTLYYYPFAGYFQLYFNKSRYYPETSKDCSVCDMTFLNQFKKRVFLSDYHPVYHLGVQGVNWKGRKSEYWS